MSISLNGWHSLRAGRHGISRRPVPALAIAALAFAALSLPAFGDDDFTDGTRGEKLHTASGFICPIKIGPFERDAVGASSVQNDAVFCAYSALDARYGTITLRPLAGAYDPRLSLANQFEELSATGGRSSGEAQLTIAGAPGVQPLSVYSRTYETTKLGDRSYRVLFTGAALGNWAVETSIEYATPRDEDAKRAFLNAVYVSALGRIARAGPPLAQPPMLPAAPHPR
jgi:hypothetical protein